MKKHLRLVVNNKKKQTKYELLWKRALYFVKHNKEYILYFIMLWALFFCIYIMIKKI